MSLPSSNLIAGLAQVAQKATDLDASIAFYRDVLGLRFIARFDPPGFAFFDMGDGTRLLLEPPASPATLYFRVADVRATAAELKAKGVQFIQDPQVIFKDEQGQFGPAGEEE